MNRISKRRWLLAGFLPVATLLAALEPDQPEITPARRDNIRHVEEWTREQRGLSADDGDRLALSGLVADRRAREVRLWGEATGLQAGDIVEFVLISTRSGHDYEALAVALAEPSAIHESLEFIGMRPGLPADPAQNRFWPRGERVFISVRLPASPENDAGDRPRAEKFNMEELLFDREKRTPLPVRGFVFTGSEKRPDPRTGAPVYAADVFGPNAIVACYNTPATVMDVPALASQGDVYGSVAPHPERLLPKGALLEIVLRPEYPPDRHRVFQARLRIAAAATNAAARAGEGLRFFIEPHQDADAGAPEFPVHGAGLAGLLAWLEKLVASGRDLFVIPSPDPDLPWTAVRDFYGMLEEIENAGAARIDPPQDGPYYRALLPADWFRDRESRPAHPDELVIARAESGMPAVWTYFEEEWPEDGAIAGPIAHPRTETVVDARALSVLQRERNYRPQPAVLLIFAPPGTSMGALNEWMSPLMEIYPTQYVFDAP